MILAPPRSATWMVRAEEVVGDAAGARRMTTVLGLRGAGAADGRRTAVTAGRGVGSGTAALS